MRFLNIPRINEKAMYVIFSMIIFSFIYMFINDSEWYGVNQIRETIKDEVMRQKIETDMKKGHVESVNKDVDEGFQSNILDYKEFLTLEEEAKDSNNEKKATDKKTIDDLEKDENEMIFEIDKVENDVLNDWEAQNVKPTFFKNYFNRLYFSVVTGCLLGYGDIYPISIRLKAIVCIQALLTLIIIVY